MSIVQRVTLDLLEEILPLIATYQEFYGARTSSEKNRSHFAMLARNEDFGIQFLAREETGRVIGFATLYFPMSSLSAGRSCLLNDLFTESEFRGQGVARSLIKNCRKYAATRGFAAIDWITQDSNESAQRLYNRMDVTRSTWLHYEMRTSR